jgi:2-polyprenyl-3-methyl-5-hydroxy-6-metoxy-1,4-benzoquinol methylase
MNRDYIASEYRRMHKRRMFSGISLERHLPEIQALIKEYNIKTILDYGCGQAICHKKIKLGDVTLYDPYFEPYSKKPEGTFDMVICTDVLEHVPMEDIGKVSSELLDYTDKVLFLVISTVPAKKKFSNGENVHVTIRPPFWWDIMFNNAKDIKLVSHYV